MALVTVEKGHLQLKAVCYQYPKSTALNLRDIHLKINPGEFVAIMGRTGAGKTTLQMLFNGLIPHFFEGDLSGEIFSNGLNIEKFRIQTLSRFTGFVMQDPETQIFGVTVEKDVAFGPGNLCIPREEIHRRIENALQLVRLSGYENKSTVNLSGGEKQRLAIAGILAMKPSIIVLDEPTSELDPVGKSEIFQTLADLRKKQNLTILLATHDSEEVLEYADRALVLDQGRIVWDGKPAELFRNRERLDELGIRVPEVTELGFALQSAGIISREQIPLNLTQATTLMRQLLVKKYEPGDSLVQKAATESEQQPVIIRVQNLSHEYQTGVTVLNNLSLDIRKGELIAIVGQNGAGKTTLVKHFNGLLKPTSGEVMVDGMDVRKTEIATLARTVGYVFQNPDHQIFCPTVEEEIAYGLRKFGLSAEQVEDRICQSLEYVELTESRNRHPFTLGKGERQKLAVATVLAMSPRIIVIDEPTTGQDWTGIKRMMQMIQDLNQKGHTIVMITHNMRIVAELAHRVIVMHFGSILLDDKPDQVFRQKQVLSKSYLHPPQIVDLAMQLTDLGIPNDIASVDMFLEYMIQNRTRV